MKYKQLLTWQENQLTEFFSWYGQSAINKKEPSLRCSSNQNIFSVHNQTAHRARPPATVCKLSTKRGEGRWVVGELWTTFGFTFLVNSLASWKSRCAETNTLVLLVAFESGVSKSFYHIIPHPQYFTDCRLSELESPSIALNKVMLFVKEAEVTRREFKLKASSTLKSWIKSAVDWRKVLLVLKVILRYGHLKDFFIWTRK